MSFSYAPVTKGLMIGVGLASIVGSLFDVKHYMHLQLVPHISRHRQYWRLLTSALGFVNSSELFVAEILLFRIGVQVERLFGSRRYGSFVLVSTALSTALSIAALLLGQRMGLAYIPPGPFALTFSILYQYMRVVPSTYNFKVFSVDVSNKIFTYILVAQLALSQLPGSAAASLIGVLVGQLYRADIVGLKSYRVGPRAASFCSRVVQPLLGSTRPPRRSARATPSDRDLRGARTDDGVATARTDAPPSGDAPQGSVVREWVSELTGARRNNALRTPTDAEITQLTAMFPGSSRAQVTAALQQSPNMERAVEMLLGSGQ